MHRRTYLATASSGLLITLAGCQETGGTDATTTPGPPLSTSTATSAPPIQVSARDSSSESPDVDLQVEYAVRAQDELPTDPVTLAEDGHTWLLVRMDITNRGEAARDLRMFQYVLEADGGILEPVFSGESWEVAEKSAAPGETVTGWVPFHPSTSISETTLTVRENTQSAFNVSFTHNPELDARIP